MPYNKRKQKCKQSDGDAGSYVLSYTDKKGKKHRACHTSKKNMQGQIAAIEAEADEITGAPLEEYYLRLFIREALHENLWDNIRKAQASGKKRNHPNSKAYKAAKKAGQKINRDAKKNEADHEPDKPLEETDNPCWDGYRPGAQSGKKTKKGRGKRKRVPNCEKINEDDKESLDEYGDMNEALDYHLDAGVGVDMNVFRPGSTAFFALFREARRRFYGGAYIPKTTDEYELLEDLDIGEFAIYEGQLVPLDYPIMEGNEDHLNEAEYKGKKVNLNKPKRGGKGGKAYVYVNSGKKTKDGKIKAKKVSFGSSMPDAMGDSPAHKKRRKSFGDRHNCSDKKDKTKAGYWSCRATKFFGRDIAGWW